MIDFTKVMDINTLFTAVYHKRGNTNYNLTRKIWIQNIELSIMHIFSIVVNISSNIC